MKPPFMPSPPRGEFSGSQMRYFIGKSFDNHPHEYA
jgi:hypothetical protein